MQHLLLLNNSGIVRRFLLPNAHYLTIIFTILWSYAGGLNIPINGSGLSTIGAGLQDLHTFCESPILWRPFANYLSRFLFAGFWLNPLPYHVLDLVIHSLNALLVYHIATKLSKDSIVALAAGLMFAAFYRHAGMMFGGGLSYEDGYAFFCLVALATFLHYQDTNKPVYLVISLFCILIALPLKESALVAFPLIVVLDQLYRPHPLPRIRWGLIFCLVIIGVIYTACRMHFTPYSAGGVPGWLAPIKTLGVGKMLDQIYKGLYLTISNVCPGRDMSGVFYLGFILFVWKAPMHRRLVITTGTLLITSVLPLFFTCGLTNRYVYLSTAFSVMLLAVVIRYSARALAERILPSYSDIGVGLVTGVVLLLIVSFNIHKIHERAVQHTEAGDLLWSNIEDILTAFPNGTKGFRLCLVNTPVNLPSSSGGLQVWDGNSRDANWLLPLFYKGSNRFDVVRQLTTGLGYPVSKRQGKISVQISNEELDALSRDPKNRIMVFNPYTKHLEDMTRKTSQEIQIAIRERVPKN